MVPNFSLERGMVGGGYVVGVDEVGRGAMAGPVVAVALAFSERVGEEMLLGVDDSKKLSKKRREGVSSRLETMREEGLCVYAYGEASVEEIDRMNILQASLKAMSRAMVGIEGEVRGFLVDGTKRPEWKGREEVCCVKGGDGRSLSIAGASIMAKVYRDGVMRDLGELYGCYGWSHNSGYGTRKHLEMIREEGLTCHHRLSFRWEKAFERRAKG